MLRFGTVSFSDMYYFSDARARAVIESGIKCNLSEAALSFTDEPYSELPIAKVNEHLIDAYHNAANGRLKVDLSMHAEYTSNPALVEAVGQLACDAACAPTSSSRSQTGDRECARRRRNEPGLLYDSLGLLPHAPFGGPLRGRPPTTLGDPARRGVTAVTNPASNLKLASGIAPVAAMLDAGVAVALGTDGPASNNNHDMFQDMYLLALLQKGASGDPCAVSPAQALQIATENGARAQGRDDCGAIKVGNKADLVVVDVDQPHLHPATDLASNLVYAAHGSDVVLTMVDGAVLYRDGEWPTIDVERAEAETDAACKRMRRRCRGRRRAGEERQRPESEERRRRPEPAPSAPRRERQPITCRLRAFRAPFPRSRGSQTQKKSALAPTAPSFLRGTSAFKSQQFHYERAR